MIGTLIDQINLFSLTGNFGGVQLLDKVIYDGEEYDSETVDGAFATVMVKIQELINSIWKWVIIALAAVVVIWGVYIGVRIAIAHRNEDKINSRDMLKNLAIGIIIIFVIALGVPLIINALAAWVG